jgi:hypothetical protein
MFEADEWQAAYILNKKHPPDQPPTLNECGAPGRTAGRLCGPFGAMASRV